MLTVGSNLYVGGFFTEIAGVHAHCLAKWDGQTWSEVGGGVQGSPANVSALFMDIDGTNLYVGGSFTNAGSVAANNVAKWNGQSWEALGNGIRYLGGGLVNYYPPTVTSFYKQGTNLFVGGIFTHAANVDSANIACWDGAQWHDVGGGAYIITTGTDPTEVWKSGRVYSVTGDGTNIYVGGLFTTAGNVAASNLARWDGANWHAIGNTSEGSTSWVYNGESVSGFINSLVWRDNSLYIAGDFTHLNDLNITNLARWNGAGWEAPIVIEGSTTAMVQDAADLYVTGQFNRAAGISATNIIALRNGHWESVAPLSGLEVIATLRRFRDELFIGGNFSWVNDVSAKNIAKLGPLGWKAVAPGDGNTFNGLTGAIASDGTNFIVSGLFSGAGEKQILGFARLNGAEWSSIPPPKSPWNILKMAVAGTNLYISGYFISDSLRAYTNLARWDGQQWSSVGNLADQPTNILPMSLTVAGTNLYVIGDGPTCKRWDGSNWTSIFSVIPTQETLSQSLTTDGTNLFVALQHGQDPFIATRIAKANLDGSDFQEFPADLPLSYVEALLVTGTNIWAAGAGFTGSYKSDLYSWNGDAWKKWNLFEDSGSIYLLGTIGSNIIAAGSFQKIAGVEANSVALWDGVQWRPLDGGLTVQGLPASPSGFAVIGKRIAFVGAFDHAGNQPVNNFALWNQADPVTLQLSGLNPATLKLSGGVGDRVQIETADQIDSWTKLSELQFLNSTHQIPDPRPQPASRFYRAKIIEP